MQRSVFVYLRNLRVSLEQTNERGTMQVILSERETIVGKIEKAGAARHSALYNLKMALQANCRPVSYCNKCLVEVCGELQCKCGNTVRTILPGE